MKTILHIDFNSYFATVEQQANPRLRGKPIGVTGGDRLERTVIGAASIEAKKFGVKTGMHYFEARKLCPQIILVKGDSDKYLECTKRFLNILKDYSPYMEVFSIDEVFLEIPTMSFWSPPRRTIESSAKDPIGRSLIKNSLQDDSFDSRLLSLATEIKSRIKEEIGEWISCSIGISYCKLIAKLAGSLYKPDGLVVIADQEAAIRILDQVELDEICGIGFRIKKRLNNMGVFNFKTLREVPLENLLASFKSYGQILYNMARGIDNSKVMPFYQKEEVKSVGHRHTIDHDTKDLLEIKQIFLKLTELIARKLRSKNLVGKTITVWYRATFQTSNPGLPTQFQSRIEFKGGGMQITIPHTSGGLEIFNAAWKIFLKIWDGEKVRMVGVSVSNLKPQYPETLNFLPSEHKKEIITKALDKINNKYGEFTLQRAILLASAKIFRKPNPFLADIRFKI